MTMLIDTVVYGVVRYTWSRQFLVREHTYYAFEQASVTPLTFVEVRHIMEPLHKLHARPDLHHPLHKALFLRGTS